MHIYILYMYIFLHHFNMYIYNHIMHLLPKTFPGHQSPQKTQPPGSPRISWDSWGRVPFRTSATRIAMSDSEMMTMVEDLCHTNRDRPKGFCWFVGVIRVLGGGQEVKILGFFMFPSKDGIDLGSWSNEITLQMWHLWLIWHFLRHCKKAKTVLSYKDLRISTKPKHQRKHDWWAGSEYNVSNWSECRWTGNSRVCFCTVYIWDHFL